MRPLRALRLAPVLLLVSSLSSHAQYVVKAVHFKGPTPYADTDLQAVSGLQPGLAFTANDLQAAAQKLIDTGAFDDVQVALLGPFRSIDVNFTLKSADPSHILPASFTNLIWWQPAELQSALHASLPLFNGTIPEAGNQQEAVQAALQQLLTAKGITATLIHSVIEPTNALRERVVEYKVTSPEIRLHSATINGVSPAFAGKINELITRSVDTPYNEGLTNSSFTGKVLDVYRDTGNLDASFTQLQRTPQPGSSTLAVDLAATIDEGHPFHVSTIAFAGSPLFSAQEFSATTKLHPGDLATRAALLESVAPISDAYGRQGYMDAAIQPGTQLDPATHQVAYTITVVPGEQYHLREVKALNLDPNTLAQFNQAWTLQPGALYDSTYLVSFLKKNVAQPYLRGYAPRYRVERDPESHLVTVTFSFERLHRQSGQ
jgi:outer membrane protein insertion porin family